MPFWCHLYCNNLENLEKKTNGDVVTNKWWWWMKIPCYTWLEYNWMKWCHSSSVVMMIKGIFFHDPFSSLLSSSSSSGGLDAVEDLRLFLMGHFPPSGGVFLFPVVFLSCPPKYLCQDSNLLSAFGFTSNFSAVSTCVPSFR